MTDKPKKAARPVDPKDEVKFAPCVGGCGLDEVAHRPGRGQRPICSVCKAHETWVPPVES